MKRPVADRVKDSPELRARLGRGMIATMVIYAALALVGLYFLIDDRFLPGIGCLLRRTPLGSASTFG